MKNDINIVDNSIHPIERFSRIIPTNLTDVAHIAIRNSLDTPIRMRKMDIHRSYLKKIIDARAINARLHNMQGKSLLISAEAFSFIRKFHETLILNFMFRGFRVIPIFLFRDKSRWLQSWKGQMSFLMEQNGITDSIPDSVFDFRDNSWLTDDNAIIRLYGANTKALSYEDILEEYGSVIPAFLQAVNLNPLGCPPWDQIWRNKSN